MAMSLPVFRRFIRNQVIKVSISRNRFLSTSLQGDVISSKTENYSLTGDIKYPHVKPKFPPGKWGEMDHIYAWQWQKMREDLLGIPDVQGRLDYLSSPEMVALNSLPFYDHPDYLKFATFATKSCILPWSKNTPVVYSDLPNIDALVEDVRQSLIDHILIEKEYIVREESLNNQKAELKSTFRCIVDTLVTHFSEKYEHLRNCMYDEDVIVRTLWDRHGIERKRRVRTGPEGHFKIKSVMDQRLFTSCIFDAMLRSDLPLPQFVERDKGLSTESEAPHLDYKFNVYGIVKNHQTKLKSLLAGHLLGDPCEYGHTGFVSTHLHGSQLDEKFGVQTAKNCRLGRGLMMVFSWLQAQAYNQGFSGVVDMSYPLTSQIVLSDGHRFSFLAYQLNTVELFKSDDAQEMVNLCWYTDEMPLYECIENGEVKGVNDEVVKMLIRMFLLQPTDRGYDMKPTVTEKETDLRLKTIFIPEKADEIVEEEEEEQFIV